VWYEQETGIDILCQSLEVFIDIHIFFTGILEKWGIFYFEPRRMVYGQRGSVRGCVFDEDVAGRTGSVILAGHQVDHILFSISILKGELSWKWRFS
jgi:hypothetical protein